MPKLFDRMIDDLEFDISEMAIVTFLQLKEMGKAFTGLPLFPMRAFPQATITYNVNGTCRSTARRGGTMRRSFALRVLGARIGFPVPLQVGFELTHLYGLTEPYGPATLNEWHAAWDELPAEARLAKRIRQGVRYHALEDLTVMNPATMEKTPADGETIGEVMFRGNIVMKGYLKNPDATNKAFAGGWFRSGDLGVMHPDGYIQLKDRSKDIIISGGENISSIEIEDVLYRHPDVAGAAVVAKQDTKWGETPCAFVELRPDTDVTAEEIIAWCKETLARFKCPRHVVFTELPKTSTGKIQKFKLRELAKNV